MHIEKCSIKRTETRTANRFLSPKSMQDLLAGDSLVCYANGDDSDTPVTLTYPAPVQVEGVRVEMSKQEWREVIEALAKAKGLAWDFACKMDDVLGSGPFNDDAQPDHEAARARATTIAVSVNKSVDAKVAESIAQPAPQDAGERVPYTKETWPKGVTHVRTANENEVFEVGGTDLLGVNVRSPKWSATVAWWRLAGDCELSLDGGATWRPCYQAKQPATLPWRDLGPGLSVAVVEGRGVYQVRPVAGGWVASITEMDGLIAHVSAESTLAAAKAACDAHHAKGGEA